MARWVILLKKFNSEYAQILLRMTRNDSEWVGMAKKLSLNFFTQNLLGSAWIPTILLGSAQNMWGRVKYWIHLESTWNRHGIHLEFIWNGPGMTWNRAKKTSLFYSDSTWNDLEWPGMANNLSLNFLPGMRWEFTWIPTKFLPFCLDSPGFLPFHPDPGGMCGGG